MSKFCLVILCAVLGVSGAYAQVSYELGAEVALLDAAFYAGEAADGSDIAGRQAIYYALRGDGQTAAVLAINNATFQDAVFLVEVGFPATWYRLTADSPFSVDPPLWTPDNSRIIVQNAYYDVETGAQVYDFETQDDDLPTGAGVPNGITRKATDNWLVTLFEPDTINREIIAFPIMPNGEVDPSRDKVALTQFMAYPGGPGEPSLSQPRISADGSKVTFSVYIQSKFAMQPDISDVYVLDNVDAILAAPLMPDGITSTLAPTDLTHPNIIDVRAGETMNFVHCMNFSQDNSLIFSCEDFNNVFDDDDFFGTLANGDFDIVISNSDGSGADTRIAIADNQGQLQASPGGTRIFYARTIMNRGHLFASTLTIGTTVTGTPVGAPEDNVLEITTAQEQGDASGTSVVIPAGTVIDFPDDAPQQITIRTPISPVEEAQLPSTSFVDAIPVVREFGPNGATFDPPVEVTISYTDSEILGLDEATLRPYLFNAGSGAFDIAVPLSDIVSRDLVNNSITFGVSHFSTYGLGGVFGASLPAATVAGLLGLMGSLSLAAMFALRRRSAGR